jgi:hypothetical protein
MIANYVVDPHWFDKFYQVLVQLKKILFFQNFQHIYLSLGLREGRPSYRRSLKHFFSFCLFVDHFCSPAMYKCELMVPFALHRCCGSRSALILFRWTDTDPVWQQKNPKKEKSGEISKKPGGSQRDVVYLG